MSCAFDPSPLDAAAASATADGDIVGTVIAVAHRGRNLHVVARGWADREKRSPMAGDAVFRLASLTKAVTCVAALAMVEAGLLSLDDRVTRWLPWFAPALPTGERPPIRIVDLITHRSGLGYGFGQPRGNAYEMAGVSDGLDDSGLTLEANLRRLAGVPLLDAPGTAWRYSLGIDVLGAVLERAAGRPLADVVAETVTRRLGMAGVDFAAPPATALVTPYAGAFPEPARMDSVHAVAMGSGTIHYAPARAWSGSAFPSGGTGLVGSAPAFLRFLEAMRTGGEGVVSPAMARRFATDAVGGAIVGMPGSGLGWGLGVAVMRDPAATGSPLGAGSWLWGGVYGHSYWVDPVGELSVVALTNTALAGMAGPFPESVKRAVYAGLAAGSR